MTNRFWIIVFVTACALPHVDPQPRSTEQAKATVVQLQFSCTDPDPFANPEPGRSLLDHPIHWGGGWATGVVISERHVLTAAHAAYCGPTIPYVMATLPNGRQRRMLVTYDGYRHKPFVDISRLEIASGSVFELGIAPPRLGTAHDGDAVTIYTLHGALAGALREPGELTEVDGVHGYPGDSGSPAYIGDDLVGIVSGGEDTEATVTFTPVAPRWLEGT